MRYNRFYQDNNFLTPTTYTAELATYVESLCYEDLPVEVVERVKALLLQTIGAALAAANTPISDKALSLALEANTGEGGTTHVWGTGQEMSAVNSALALGTMCDALEWSDCSATGHPSAGVIPCAWLAAEEKHKSGKDLITAIVAGYEVGQRIATTVQPSAKRLQEKGWGVTSWQIFNCILPIAKLYGLDARKINQAIGMGCESSPIPTSYSFRCGSEFRHFEYGYRGRDAFLLVKSVEKGIHNQRDALDDFRCYTGAIASNADGSSSADINLLTKDLGSKYAILDTHLRRWPACMGGQLAADSIATLCGKYEIAPENVAEVQVDPAVEWLMKVPAEGPLTSLQAQNSIPWIVAAELMGLTPGESWYSPTALYDQTLQSLAKHVRAKTSFSSFSEEGLHYLKNPTAIAKSVTITLKDGTIYQNTANYTDANFNEVTDQFRRQAARILPESKAEKIIEAIRNLEFIGNISSLSEWLS